MFGGSKGKKAKASKPKAEKAPMLAPMPAYKPPSHDERLHNAAADEHVNAARDFVAGRISKSQFAERKARAASIMSKTPKKTK